MKGVNLSCAAVLVCMGVQCASQSVDIKVTYPVKDSNLNFYGSEVAPELQSVSDVSDGALYFSFENFTKVKTATVTLPNDFEIAGSCRSTHGSVNQSKSEHISEYVTTANAPSTRILITPEMAIEKPLLTSTQLDEEKIVSPLTQRVRTQRVQRSEQPAEEQPQLEKVYYDYKLSLNAASIYSCPVRISQKSAGSTMEPDITLVFNDGTTEQTKATGKVVLDHQPLGMTFEQTILNNGVHNSEDPYKDLEYSYRIELPSEQPSITSQEDLKVKVEFLDQYTTPLVLSDCSALGTSLDQYLTYEGTSVSAKVPQSIQHGGVSVEIKCKQIMERGGASPIRVSVQSAEGQLLYVWHGAGAAQSDSGKSMLTFQSLIEFDSEIAQNADLKRAAVVDATRSTQEVLQRSLVFQRPLMRGRVTLIKSVTSPGSAHLTQLFGLRDVNGDDDNAQLAAVSQDFTVLPHISRGVMQQKLRFHDISQYPDHCTDGLPTRGMETDTDCGGECAPCDDTRTCLVDSDCKSLVCSKTTFLAPGLDGRGTCAPSVGLPIAIVPESNSSRVAAVSSAMMALLFLALLLW